MDKSVIPAYFKVKMNTSIIFFLASTCNRAFQVKTQFHLVITHNSIILFKYSRIALLRLAKGLTKCGLNREARINGKTAKDGLNKESGLITGRS